MWGLALFSMYFKTLSCLVFTFKMLIVCSVFSKVFENYCISLTPPIEITLFKRTPPFRSIVFYTKALISYDPKL